MDSRISEILALIDEKFMDRISVSSLAKDVGLTPAHMGRLFRAAVGTTPHARLMDVRFRHATRLLSITRLPVVEVGIRSGCFDPSHFVRDFQLRYQLSPTEYRERYHIAVIKTPKPSLPGKTLPLRWRLSRSPVRRVGASDT